MKKSIVYDAVAAPKGGGWGGDNKMKDNVF